MPPRCPFSNQRAAWRKKLATARATHQYKALFGGDDPGFDEAALTPDEHREWLEIRKNKRAAGVEARTLGDLRIAALAVNAVPILGQLASAGIAAATGGLTIASAATEAAAGSGAAGVSFAGFDAASAIEAGAVLTTPTVSGALLVPSGQVATARTVAEARAGYRGLGLAAVKIAASVGIPAAGEVAAAAVDAIVTSLDTVGTGLEAAASQAAEIGARAIEQAGVEAIVGSRAAGGAASYLALAGDAVSGAASFVGGLVSPLVGKAAGVAAGEGFKRATK